MAARATAGRRPPPPRTNRSLPGGGRFMKWGRWQGEGRRRDCQGASSPLPALHSSQVLPPWRERWWGCCSSGGALYLGCTAAEWTQLHNGPHTSDSPLLVHPVSSDSQLIPTSTSGRIAKSVNFRSQDPSQKRFGAQKNQGGLYTDHNIIPNICHKYHNWDMWRNIARGTTDPEIDSITWTKFSDHMAALVTNLATRWHYMH